MRTILVVASVLMYTTHIHAEWPLARHDARRTGMASGTSNVTTPVAYWRYYLGGAPTAVRVHDVDGDSSAEVITLAGGRLSVRTSSNVVVWESGALGLWGLGGVADLDGNGTEEIVAVSSNRAYAFSAATGAVEWTLPAGELWPISVVRVGDVNGDTLPELVLGSSMCSTVHGPDRGFVYSFADGVATAERLWTFPSVGLCGGDALSLIDFDGDGADEVVLPSYEMLQVLDGSSGDELARLEGLDVRIAKSDCRVVDADSSGDEELICLLSVSSTDSDGRQVFVLDADSDGAIQVAWSKILAPVSQGDLRYQDPIVDLDRDGQSEIVVAGDIDGVSTMYVLDAMSGDEEATLIGHRPAGAIQLGSGDALPVLVTSSDDDLYGWVYDDALSESLSMQWTLPELDVVAHHDAGLHARMSLATRLLVTDVDQDGTAELLTNERTDLSSLVAYEWNDGTLSEIARTTGSRVQSVWATSPLAPTQTELALVSGEGLLTLLGEDLSPVSANIRAGGFFTGDGSRYIHLTAVAANLGGGGESILVVDSQGDLNRVDADQASWAVFPTTVWSRAETYAPSIVANLDDGRNPGIAAFALRDPESDNPGYLIEALRADGTVLWSRLTDAEPRNDIVPANLDGDGIPDLVFNWVDPSETQTRTRAVSGITGTTLWDAVPIGSNSGASIRGIAVGPFDGDARDDVWFQAAGTRVLSGATGNELASVGTAVYFLPSLVDIDDDGNAEVTLHGGFEPARTLTHDLSGELWRGTEDDRPWPLGAFATCSDGSSVLVEASDANVGRIKFTELAGASAGTFRAALLVGGQLHADGTSGLDDSVSALTAATVHPSLRGDGRAVALVGSVDGWLYAVDPCDESLVFSVQFGSQVGEPIFADTDGDGLDEILVSVADGYLYGLKQKAIDEPSFVYDTDPEQGFTDDIDEVFYDDHLSARWDEVPGSTGYEVAVVTSDGVLVDGWHAIGAVLDTTLTGLSLEQDTLYLVAVRAQNPSGRSVDAVSDGVWVRTPLDSDGGIDSDGGTSTVDPGAGCGSGCRCSIERPGTLAPNLLVAALLAGWMVWRTRRR